MFGNYGRVFKQLVIALVVMVIIVLGLTVFFVSRNNTIKSDHLIKPKIEVVIKDGQADTLYIYEK